MSHATAISCNQSHLNWVRVEINQTTEQQQGKPETSAAPTAKKKKNNKGENLQWECGNHGTGNVTTMALEALLGQAAWVYRGNPELLAQKADSNSINKF